MSPSCIREWLMGMDYEDGKFIDNTDIIVHVFRNEQYALRFTRHLLQRSVRFL